MKTLLTIFSMLMIAVSSFGATANIAWDASTSAGLQSYKGYKSTTTITAGTAPSSNPSAAVAFTVPSTQLTGVISGLTDGTWYFSITAVGTNGLESVFGNVISLVVVNAPTAPSGLAATSLSTSQIQLNWADNATTETGYAVERSTDNVNFTVVAGTLSANTVTYTDSGLTPNTLYYYRVRAFNTGGNSAYTAVASARTAPLVAPAPPTNLRIVSVGP